MTRSKSLYATVMDDRGLTGRPVVLEGEGPYGGAVEVPDTAWQYVDLEGVDVLGVWALYAFGNMLTEDGTPIAVTLPARGDLDTGDPATVYAMSHGDGGFVEAAIPEPGDVVTATAQLVGAGEAGRAGPHDGDGLAGGGRHLGHPIEAPLPLVVRDEALDAADADGPRRCRAPGIACPGGTPAHTRPAGSWSFGSCGPPPRCHPPRPGAGRSGCRCRRGSR